MRVRLWFSIALLIGIGAFFGWAYLAPDPRDPSTADNTDKGSSKDGSDGGDADAKGKSKDKQKGKGETGKSKDNGSEKKNRPSDEPWSHVLAADVPRFEDVCFDDFPVDQTGVESDELRRWLTPFDPPNLRAVGGRGQPPVVDGLTRLRAPWLDQTALRLAIRPHQVFKIHVYSGNQGVSFYYYPNPRPNWAAYATRRKPDTPRAELLAYVAADNDRYARSGWGTFSLHYEQEEGDGGQLVLTRGSVRLLNAPLAKPPDEVFFDGRASWRGITMFRCGPVPPEETARPLVLKSDKPAKLAWVKNLPRGAALKRHDDGRLELTARRTQSDATATLPIAEPGLYEVIFQVEQPQPGTGVFLGAKDGKPIHRVGFFSEEQSRGGIVSGFSSPGDNRDSVQLNPDQRPTPFVGQTQWLRLVLGIGVFKCWTSGDGRSWARLPQTLPRGDNLRNFASVGLYCLRGNGPRAITLRTLEIREFSAVTSLASEEAREKAVPMDRLPDLPAWLQAVAASQPQGIDSGDWRRACAVATLSGSPPAELAKSILDGLLREAVEQPTPVEDRLRLLEEAGLLWDATQQPDKDRFDLHYNHLANLLVRRGHPDVLETIPPALVRSTIWSPILVQIIPARAAQADLLARVNGQPPADVLRFRYQFDYWHRTGGYHPIQLRNRNAFEQWIDWGAVLANRSRGRGVSALLGGGEGDRSAELAKRQKIPPMKPAWRHPLIEKISKAGFNVLAELGASVDGQSYEDACQIISTADPQAALGLLPDGKDPKLMVSLPSAVALAIQTHPGLRKAMQEELAPIGRLRVRRAKLSGDVATIRAATVQFFGTEAAAEAHHWLGDQALAAGDLGNAIGHYTRALDRADLAARGQISAMLRLASAMAGRRFGEPVEQPVTFGGSRLSPTEFEQLVSEMLASRKAGDNGGAAASVVPSHPAVGAPPRPARYDLRPWGEHQGVGVTNTSNVDWAARQTRAVAAGDLMLVSDGQKLRAYQLDTGKATWDANGNRPLVINSFWFGVASQPVVAGDRVFVRRGGRSTVEIVCLNLSDGKTQWSFEPRSASNGGVLISDPLLVGGKLFAFSAIRHSDGTLDVRLLEVNPGSGKLLQQIHLGQLRDSWSGRPPADATVAGDLILANVGHCVICCDSTGAAKWVRRLTRLPDNLPQVGGEPIIVQHREPPLVVGRRVYVAQRKTRAVECLDIETGRLHWRHVDPEVRRVLGVTAGHTVVESAAGLTGLDAQTGESIWHRPIERMLEARLAGGDGLLLYSRAESLPGNNWRPHLVWLDPRTGRDVATMPVAPAKNTYPLVGPLVAHQNRAWLFIGTHPTNGHRTGQELIRQGDPLGGQAKQRLLDHWLPRSHAALRHDLAAVAPGWTLLSSDIHPRTGLQDEIDNQRDVAVTLADAGRPVRMLRQVTIPRNGPAKLIVHVGSSGGARWELEISAAGKSLQRSEINGWLRREIDLTPLAGQTVWLTANHRSLDGKQSFANWKQLEVVLP